MQIHWSFQVLKLACHLRLIPLPLSTKDSCLLGALEHVGPAIMGVQLCLRLSKQTQLWATLQMSYFFFRLVALHCQAWLKPVKTFDASQKIRVDTDLLLVFAVLHIPFTRVSNQDAGIRIICTLTDIEFAGSNEEISPRLQRKLRLLAAKHGQT